jgi:hypothetical protein
MYESIYNINFGRLVANILPIKRRTAIMIQWLLSLIEPIAQMHIQFIRFRVDANYKLEHTQQVFSIENVLNDAFDTTQRGIFIEDGVYTFPVWFYDRAEDKPVFFNSRSNASHWGS